MNLYVGTSGYAYKEWKGTFYPQDLPAKEMLRFYSQRFRSVEINNTFYRMPRPEVLEHWADQVPEGFKFVLKAPQRITHFQRLKNTDDSVSYLLRVAKALGNRLGPILFQMPPDFQRDTGRLQQFLRHLPDDCRAAFEFRHSSWFEESVFELLRDRGAALCVAEAEEGVSVPPVATADWGYLRLRRLDYTPRDLGNWMGKIQAQRWKDTFVFFKHEAAGKGPQFASEFCAKAPGMALDQAA